MKKISDKMAIRTALDRNMKSAQDIFGAVFLVSKNIIYEGVHVMAASEGGTRSYSFTNSDSQYRSLVVQAELSDIGYIIVH